MRRDGLSKCTEPATRATRRSTSRVVLPEHSTRRMTDELLIAVPAPLAVYGVADTRARLAG